MPPRTLLEEFKRNFWGPGQNFSHSPKLRHLGGEILRSWGGGDLQPKFSKISGILGEFQGKSPKFWLPTPSKISGAPKFPEFAPNFPRFWQIRAQVVLLRGRAAREALSSKFRNFLQFQRRIRAPIQVWQDLTETLMGGSLESPPSAAFSQVLTLAATEPLTLEHSRPPQNLGTPQNSGPSQNSGTPPEVETPQNPGSPQNPGGWEVNFGRIYEFLARISAGGEAPPLPPTESAVVLSLLGALPAELGALGALGGLQRHLRGLWGSLSAPQTPGGPPQSAEPAQCPPLNPLLVPLGLLGRAA
ncbi:LOW QUALITY PROTEIN: snRNA-activating protein complex subunit 2 [Passerculus sandwichensis]